MRYAGVVVLVSLTHAPPLLAQPRIYAAATSSAETGSRGSIDVGVVATVGALAGLRLGRGWSLEAEADQGIAGSRQRAIEGFLFSLKPAVDTEDRRRIGVFGRSVFTETAANGYSAQIVWSTREPGRINAAVTGGITWRHFSRRHVRTITRIGPEAGIPADHPEVQDLDSTQRVTGGGYSAGVVLPIRIGQQVHISPEVKFTFGGISGADGFYKVLRTGVRVMWGY